MAKVKNTIASDKRDKETSSEFLPSAKQDLKLTVLNGLCGDNCQKWHSRCNRLRQEGGITFGQPKRSLDADGNLAGRQ